MKYRKKPVVIETVKFEGRNHDEVWKFMGRTQRATGAEPACMPIDTPEGTMIARPGDYIIKGVNGEFYPCKPDIFAATYEPVAE